MLCRLLCATIAITLLGASLTGAPTGSSDVQSAGPELLGTIQGTLTSAAGLPLAGIVATLAGTGRVARVDRNGVYGFRGVEPGTYTLVCSGEGFSRLQITDIVVKPDETVQLAPQEMPVSAEAMVGAKMESTVVQLEKYLVTDEKPVPFTLTDNIDIPRTVNDAQPYYMWDAGQIAISGATDLEDFFQRSVPMDTNKAVNSQSGANLIGNISQIKINGLSAGDTSGTQNTLVLVDGHRLPTINYLGQTSYQSDINGIPLGAIDHIEILPASASALYGASAAGGVVNIVLKHDYVGAQVKMTYENTFDSDAPIRNLSVTAGGNLEGGRTKFLVTANYEDQKPVLWQDRAKLVGPYQNEYFSLYPGGAAAYIGLTSGSVYLPQVFIKSNNGTPLFGAGTTATFVQVPAGYAGVTQSGLTALQANVGNYNLAEPNTTAFVQGPGLLYGLLSPLTAGPKIKSMNFNVRRQMTKNIELYVDYTYASNLSHSPYFNAGNFFSVSVPSSAPTNPFGQAVTVYGSEDVGSAVIAATITRDLLTGLKFDLPGDWKADLSYSWGSSSFNYTYASLDTTAFASAVAAGTVNPFADLGRYPVPLNNFPAFYSYTAPATVNDLAVKASGPVAKLWGGDATLTLAAEHVRQGNGSSYFFKATPLVAADGTYLTYSPGNIAEDNSGYGEFFVPIVEKKNKLPFVQQLDLQISGRFDRYSTYTTAPASDTEYFYNNYGVANYSGAPEYSPSSSSDHSTPAPWTSGSGSESKWTNVLGLRYKPVDDVLLRASYSTGFSPPTPAELLTPVSTTTNTQPSSGAYTGVPTTSPWSYSTITDPALGNASYSVPVKGGGNPAVGPETSVGATWGVVFEPRWVPGLRISVDYSRVTKHDNISTLGAQNLVTNASIFPSRVIRGTPNAGQTVGPIILIDNTYLNLYKTMSSAYNIEVDYVFKLANTGTWKVFGIANDWQYYNVQSALNAPYLHELNTPFYSAISASNPSLGGNGLGYAKFKGNIGLSWQRGPWNAGWQARYIGRYTYGSAYGLGGAYPYYVGTPNGWVPGQIYHDIFAGYRLGKVGKTGSWWQKALFNSSIQVGLKNLFNTYPPYDAYGSQGGTAYSPYGDARLRDYFVTVTKDF